jgi:outer membrane protein assembly factor BamB
LVLDIGCWMLDVGCWMLGVGCWMLGVGRWVLDVGCWILGVGGLFYGFFRILRLSGRGEIPDISYFAGRIKPTRHMKNHPPVRQIFLLVLLLAGMQVSAVMQGFAAEPVRQWTHFRGSDLNGITAETGFPVEWDHDKNIAWRTRIPGKGWSSPVVYGNQIWVTTAPAEGGPMDAVCLDFNTGEILHTIRIVEPDSIYRIHDVNSYATPTAAIEEGFVYIHFGKYGTACIDTSDGEIVWFRDDMRCAHIQGPGSSVIIHDEKLIVHMEGVDVRWIYALDKRTGETIWQTHRAEEPYEKLAPIGKKAYTTPIVIEVDGRELLISNGAAVCNAYDVETGEEIWSYVRGEDSTMAMPVESEGIVYFYTSFFTPEEGGRHCELVAVDPGGTGDIEHSHVLWRVPSPSFQLLTPVVRDGLLYTIDARGTLLCLDAKTGETVWSELLRARFNSSPIYSGGLIYFSSVRGETLVIREGRTFDLVAENQVQGEIWATPAFVDGAILLRTSEYLYKIRE